MSYWRKASRLNAMPIHSQRCPCSECKRVRGPLPILSEIDDARRADGWRFWLTMSLAMFALAAFSLSIAAILDWSQTNAVEMTR